MCNVLYEEETQSGVNALICTQIENKRWQFVEINITNGVDKEEMENKDGKLK